jgi:hypothetical protein
VPGPGARWAHTMATLNDIVVLFGGNGNDGDLDDTWTWNGTQWAQQTATGPSARSSAVMGGP